MNRRPQALSFEPVPETTTNSTLMTRPHGNCYWVIPGRMMAGEYPIAIREEDGLKKLGAIVDAGISHFIDLTHAQDPLDPYEQLLLQVADQVPSYDRFAILDMGVPDSSDLTNAILDRVDSLLAEARIPYIHCWGGIGRTGTIIGCWLVRHGLSGAAALETIAGHWATVTKRHIYPRSPQTEAQCEYVLNWASQDHCLKGLGVGTTEA